LGSPKEVQQVNGDRIETRPAVTDARKVEETCYLYMKIGGGLLVAGLALMMLTVLFWLGAPLAAIGAAIIAGNILWLLQLNKKAGINVTCPHCDKQYNVLPGFHNFICDNCEHEVPVPRAA
jgi:hypothetical protein